MSNLSATVSIVGNSISIKSDSKLIAMPANDWVSLAERAHLAEWKLQQIKNLVGPIELNEPINEIVLKISKILPIIRG
ncbi:hypothetical protein [Cohnella abietis]|uniref:Uncharacterized protein n=1 Tax=Cohnella abietis TaxID=2507935 RepID=A0A3T1D344_9BACL|nr:hypothetical protein [Cohnella abietis]BBI32471.1 hypothetical protein KCTCHS21_18700 [Cohnella abietis]